MSAFLMSGFERHRRALKVTDEAGRQAGRQAPTTEMNDYYAGCEQARPVARHGYCGGKLPSSYLARTDEWGPPVDEERCLFGFFARVHH